MNYLLLHTASLSQMSVLHIILLISTWNLTYLNLKKHIFFKFEQAIKKLCVSKVLRC